MDINTIKIDQARCLKLNPCGKSSECARFLVPNSDGHPAHDFSVKSSESGSCIFFRDAMSCSYNTDQVKPAQSIPGAKEVAQ